MEQALKENTENTVLLPDAGSIERAIGALSGVCGARVVLGANAINEVHVLATPRRAPKKIIRDIESLLLVQYGYRVDYRRISLAQIAATDVPAHGQVALGSVEQIRTPHGTFVTVELFDGQRSYNGTHALDNDEAHAAANATIAALNALFVPAAPLAVRGVQCATIGMRPVVTVCVAYNVTEQVLGSAFVGHSVATAMAHAVLAATDHHLAEWLHAHMTSVFARMIGA
jgi:hypothetical protein